MKVTEPSQYDVFAADYHWLYSDRVLSGEPFVQEHTERLQALPAHAKILDCTCGIGIHALALARQGYSVQGTDASAQMVARAKETARNGNQNVCFAVCNWENLPQMFHREFDMVICGGNSLGHCRDEPEMLSSLRGLRRVLKDKGSLVLDSRNWEKLRPEKPRFHLLGSRVRNGVRCIPLYLWNFPADWEDPHVIEVVFIFEVDNTTTHRSYRVTYYPFRHEQLLDRLTQAGFGALESDCDATKEAYHVVARKR